ncbi:ATP-binding cassette domain-containing protein [Streptomyces sp. SID8361]|uniref:ABC transporter ATP-binding protein n=1 Tax=Streptomyces sp. MnatMP-M27 TaxID=1839768 RepID=UPI00081DB60E|nr:ABC transporter ATP-binding protein [Streptomyces sp. MnatMP-M27]MYU10067.1 ATP-binding cassette domain-containing protein [Streptomyces sp. SID8361]SCF68016.1 peptide/nickel transport system ATP-binding protein/peptide/nickel transport system ATP-binding protein [Streptomyces sp. MnatMP-M27]
MSAARRPGLLARPENFDDLPSEVLVQATDLQMDYATATGSIRALDSATLQIRTGQIVAIVGESGSGKSTMGMATGRLLAGNAVQAGGSLLVDGVDVLSADAAALRTLRRDSLGFIFQNPIAALDPTMRIRKQMRLVAGASTSTPESALQEVGITDVKRVLDSYPHQLSGGMAQRVGIAMALMRKPRLLVADEPTAAVDATLRGQILDLLVERCAAEGCSLMLLTHDLRAVETYATHVAVMYAGRVVEYGRAREVLSAPAHPYTRALVTALPGEERHGERLDAIGGAPPVLRGPSRGCAFVNRCPSAIDMCSGERPVLAPVPGLVDRAACCDVATGLSQHDSSTTASATTDTHHREQSGRA